MTSLTNWRDFTWLVVDLHGLIKTYRLGMGGAWAVYAALEHFAAIDGRVEQVVSLHWVLAVIEIAVVVSLWRAFNRDQQAQSAPLIRDEQRVAAD